MDWVRELEALEAELAEARAVVADLEDLVAYAQVMATGMA